MELRLFLYFILLCGTCYGQEARNTSANDKAILDSLFGYGYIKHRIVTTIDSFDVPTYQRKQFFKHVAIADSLAARYSQRNLGQYKYLLHWIANPHLSETEAGGGPLVQNECDLFCQTDTSGYSRFQKRVTTLRVAARMARQSGEYALIQSYSDTLLSQLPFQTSELLYAKQLAIKKRDTLRYIQLFDNDPYSSFTAKKRRDMSWPVTTMPEDRNFVLHALSSVDTSLYGIKKYEDPELELMSSRYSRLHDVASTSIFKEGFLNAFMQGKKRELRKLYCALVKETYTVLPQAYCRRLQKSPIAPQSIGDLNYFSLHLIQLNAFGRIYTPEMMDKYFSVIKCLAYHKAYDMESYAYDYDMYQTAVLGKHSVYGMAGKRQGYEIDEKEMPTDKTEASRSSANL